MNDALPRETMTAEMAVDLLRSWAEERALVGVLYCGGDGCSAVTLQGLVRSVASHLFTVRSDSAYFSLGLYRATFSVGPLHIVDPTKGLVPVFDGLHIESESGYWAFLAPSYVPRPEHVRQLRE